VDAHVAPHKVWFSAQAHAPDRQVNPAAHGLPQVPQFCASVCRSRQAPLHEVWVLAQPHMPATQLNPLAQGRSQPPQWLGLLVVSTHVPAHEVVVGALQVELAAEPLLPALPVLVPALPALGPSNAPLEPPLLGAAPGEPSSLLPQATSNTAPHPSVSTRFIDLHEAECEA
jgi:hypothetical protein